VTKTSSTPMILSGILGGLVAVVVGAILIATDVIDTGDETREVVDQSPITQPATGGSKGLTVGEIYDRDSPGVVFIKARGGGGETDSPFGLPNPEEGTATGSGFVLDKKGFVLTNAHVVEDANDIIVGFEEGNEVEAKVEGSDPSSDLAVLKVDTNPDKLKPLDLGDSGKVKVGDPTVAIGNPFGLDRTVTTGIVSAIQRQIQAPNGFSIDNVIQTDASINPGNSGGPLLDANGKVIGINAQIATGGASGGSVGIGFAVPINEAKRVIPQLEEQGKVERAYLGVTTAPVDKTVAEDLNLPADQGALIQKTDSGGPADDAGLKGGRTETSEGLVAGGDLIVKVDDKDIAKPEDVAAAIADNKPGDKVTVEFFRGGERRSVEVELGTRPDTVGGGGGGGGGGDGGGGGGGGGDDLFPFP
jgi:S1-C subfamily serine protease